jgi:hypothetical protein
LVVFLFLDLFLDLILQPYNQSASTFPTFEIRIL